MSRYSEYIDKEYLPGEVYGAGLSEYRFEPQAVTEYIANKKFKFDPGKDDGSMFQRFLNLQANPESLFLNKIKLPENFQRFSNMFG
jgi:hypothetical protein